MQNRDRSSSTMRRYRKEIASWFWYFTLFLTFQMPAMVLSHHHDRSRFQSVVSYYPRCTNDSGEFYFWVMIWKTHRGPIHCEFVNKKSLGKFPSQWSQINPWFIQIERAFRTQNLLKNRNRSLTKPENNANVIKWLWLSNKNNELCNSGHVKIGH